MSETVLEEAARLTSVDRQQDYGHPLDDFTRTADLWTALGIAPPFTAEDVALAMMCVKMSRERNRPKRDNRTDIAGYAGCLDELIAERERRAQSTDDANGLVAVSQTEAG